jgi:hypothetical protein
MTQNMFFQNAIFEIVVEKTLHSAREHYQLLLLGLAADQAVYSGF